LCDRSGLLGADGVYFVDRSRRPAVAAYYNSDGSAAEYSGNGLRCVGRMLLELEDRDVTQVVSGGTLFEVENLPLSREGVRNVAVRSTAPVRFGPHVDSILPGFGSGLRFTILAAPNPHLVAIVDHHDEGILEKIGQLAKQNRALFPAGVNTSLAMKASDDPRDFYVRTYERGAGFTASCASAAAASAATLVRLGLAPLSDQIQIRNLGGPLRISINETAEGLSATQSGNATYVYRTEADINLLLSGRPRKIDLDVTLDEIQAYDVVWRTNQETLAALGITAG
jgi:diaminopimelate epimerase